MENEFPSVQGTATTTKIPSTNSRVSEAPALFSKSQYPLLAPERSAVLNNQTRRKGCEQLHPKGLGVNKGHIRKIGEWRMGVGRDNSEVERVIGGVCFPDSFQRKEICVVCCGAENTVQDQLMFFFIQQLLSLAHSF